MKPSGKQKWFFPLQKKAKELIDAKYIRNGYCLVQDICKDRVYEIWNVTTISGDKNTTIVVLMAKATGSVMIYEYSY